MRTRPMPAPARTRHTSRSGPVRLLVLLALVGLIAAACGGNDDPAGTATATTAAGSDAPAAPPAACADAAALKASIADLDNLDVPNTGKAGLEAALTDIRSKLAALKVSAREQWGPQIDELESGVAAFQTSVSAFTGDLVNEAPEIARSLERIDSAWTTLERDIDQACP